MALARIAFLAALLGLVGAVVSQGFAVRGLRTELALVRETLERLEGMLDEVGRMRPTQPATAGVAPTSAVPRFAPAGAAAGATATSSAEQIADLVDRKVEARLQERDAKKPSSGGGDRKLALNELAKELGLDATAQSRAAEIADASKKEIFDLAKTARPDGTSLADELVDAMLKGDDKGTKQVFAKLFTEKVPGTSETYVAAVGRIQQRANTGLESLLGRDAYNRFQHMNLKPENIQTGFDPWADHVKARGGK